MVYSQLHGLHGLQWLMARGNARCVDILQGISLNSQRKEECGKIKLLPGRRSIEIASDLLAIGRLATVIN